MLSNLYLRTFLVSIGFFITLFSCGDFLAVKTRPDGIDLKTYQIMLAEKLPSTNTGRPGVYPSNSPVGRYGKLQVIGTQLCDERGGPVELHGLFLRALMNESKFINWDAFAWMAANWKIDILRIPYMSEGWYSEPSYINNPAYEKYIHDAVDLCEELGIYCVIDWHILKDGNPFIHAKEAREFFQKQAFLYGAKKHVLYEICNEPNGRSITWNDVVRPYAEFIIPAIQAGDSNALVIVGSSTWSQDVHKVAENPLSFRNILYSFHFYSGTHTQELRDRVKTASFKIPLFSSEWGNSDCLAQGGPYEEESRKWLSMMKERKISWTHYALTDFPEGAAVLKPGANASGGWQKGDLTLSGQFMVDIFTNK